MTPTEPEIRTFRRLPVSLGVLPLAAAAVSYLNAMGPLYGESRGKPLSPSPPRPCLHCGKEHDHNNAFCSGDCCRAYRAKKH